MATIKVRWSVNELENVMSLFDTQMVHRSPTGEPGTFVEITTELTRVPLVAGVTSYLFDDTAGDPSYYYAVSYYNSSTTESSNLSDARLGDLAGYVSVAEVRDEGLTSTDADDARVVVAIARATAMIDRVTGQWFEPRTRTFRLDGRPGEDIRMDVPIVAVTALSILEESIDLDYTWVYNRHLTQGLLAPDDRGNPRIGWRDDYDLYGYRLLEQARRFRRGFQRVTVAGVFGYTELDSSLTPGETSSGSQVPADYGDTPALIKYACLRLVLKYAFPAMSSDGDDLAMRKRLIEERTADQLYRLADPSEEDASFGITGDREVDGILKMYRAPFRVGAV